MDFSGAPTGGSGQNIAGIPAAQTSFNQGGQVQAGLGPAGDITNTYGPADNYSADRQRVEDSLMARMNPQLQIEKQGIQQQLADQGIRYGSQAYSDAMMNYSRQADDARFGAISQAGQEQQRMQQQAARWPRSRTRPSSRATSSNWARDPSPTRHRRSNSSRTQPRPRSAMPGCSSNCSSSRPPSTPSRPRGPPTCRSSTRSATSRSTRSPR